MSHDSLIIPCVQCGAKNRIPGPRIGARARCGRCGDAVVVDRPCDITDATFAGLVEGSPIPVLVDFWATWCPPCHMIAPVLADIARERAGQLWVAKLDVDKNQKTAGRFTVSSIPALHLFHRGQVVGNWVGAMPKNKLDAHLSQALRDIGVSQ